MAAGFYQIFVSPNSIEKKTVFVKPDGRYEFLAIPFGLLNVPSIYKRAIDKVLGSLRSTVAIVYIDDVLIPSTWISQGIEWLGLVIQALLKAAISNSFNVNQFLKTLVGYLGYVVPKTHA